MIVDTLLEFAIVHGIPVPVLMAKKQGTRDLCAEHSAHKAYGMVWYGMVWYGMVWCGAVWYGMVWYRMVWPWYGMVWYGMVWYGIPYHGMAWHGIVWYGMACCGMVGYGITVTRQTLRAGKCAPLSEKLCLTVECTSVHV